MDIMAALEKGITRNGTGYSGRTNSSWCRMECWDLKLDGVWVEAKAGDLVGLPRGIPHGYFNKSDKPARALFWVSPTQKLEALFNQLHNLTDVTEIVRISAQHDVNFLPPEPND